MVIFRPVFAAGIVPVVLSAGAGAAAGATATAATDAASSLPPSINNTQNLILLEIFLAILTVSFVLNFFRGRRKNAAISQQVLSSLLPLARQEFSHVGVDESGTGVQMDGFCDGYIYASGRRYTTGMTAALELRNRQDLLATLSRLVQPSMADRCTLTLPLAAGHAMEPVSLLLAKPKELERLRNDLRPSACVKAVEDMAGEVQTVRSIPGEFTVLADHDGVVNAVLSSEVRGLISPVAKYVHFVQITESGKGWDAYAEAAGERFVRVVFDIPDEGQTEMDAVVQRMVMLAVLLVDMSASLSLGKAAKAKAVALRNRIAVEKEKERQALLRKEAEERKNEKKKEEAEAAERRVAGDSKKQAKAAEKERKREIKQRMKKATRK